MGEGQRTAVISGGGLWEKTDRNGRRYFTGEIRLRVLVFPNTNKTNERSPDLWLNVAEMEIGRGSATESGKSSQ